MGKKKPPDFVPDKKFPAGHQHENKPRCQAWSYNKGRQCMGLAMAPTDKCRVHGGKNLRGISSGTYKTGRYSKYVNVLPKSVLEIYRQVENNPDYLKLKDEIELIDSRLVQLSGQIATRTSSQIFEHLTTEIQRFDQANRRLNRASNIQDESVREREMNKHRQEAAEAMANLRQHIRDGSREWWIWNDILNLIENRRRVVETERKLLIDMQMLIKLEDVAVLADALMASVRENVKDKDVRQRIQTDFIRLTS